VKKLQPKAGDRVAYTRSWLKNVGMLHSDWSQRRGTVLGDGAFAGRSLRVQWDDGPAEGDTVLTCNLATSKMRAWSEDDDPKVDALIEALPDPGPVVPDVCPLCGTRGPEDPQGMKWAHPRCIRADANRHVAAEMWLRMLIADARRDAGLDP
jgi:hypothetical protein